MCVKQMKNNGVVSVGVKIVVVDVRRLAHVCDIRVATNYCRPCCRME